LLLEEGARIFGNSGTEFRLIVEVVQNTQDVTVAPEREDHLVGGRFILKRDDMTPKSS
jgi:hypothetical protein